MYGSLDAAGEQYIACRVVQNTDGPHCDVLWRLRSPSSECYVLVIQGGWTAETGEPGRRGEAARAAAVVPSADVGAAAA